MAKCNCEFSGKCHREISPCYGAPNGPIVCDRNYKGGMYDARRRDELAEKKRKDGSLPFGELQELAELRARGSFC